MKQLHHTTARPQGATPSSPGHQRIGAPPPSASAAPDPRVNQLLAALPEADWQRLQPGLEPVDMPLGQVLSEAGQTLSHAYFPTSAIVSTMYLTEAGSSAEIAVIGREGMVGVPLFMGDGASTTQELVQGQGQGYRLPARSLREEFDRRGPLHRLLLRYTQALIAQTAQVAVCNRHHSIDQQLCRWLLMRLDRQTGDELLVTHELIARLLGVRREGVTEAALALQHSGLIRYRRGHVTVLDRAGLQARSCECHGVVKTEYDRLLPQGLRLRV
jgi:CRP-like cAMP-binding protein